VCVFISKVEKTSDFMIVTIGGWFYALNQLYSNFLSGAFKHCSFTLIFHH